MRTLSPAEFCQRDNKRIKGKPSWVIQGFNGRRSSRPFIGRCFQTCRQRQTSSLCPADRHLIHAQMRLAHADGDPLAALAAIADAGIELHVVADHRDAFHSIGPLPISMAPLIGAPTLPSSIR